MEQITVSGSPEPVPASPIAARLLRERLESVRGSRGPEAAAQLEELVGRRIVTLREGGMPSIDLATMRSIVDYVELPEEPEPTGMGRAVAEMKDKLARRGGMR